MTTQYQISSQLDFAKATGLMPAFATASFLTGIDSRLLMAVASRESNLGLALDENYLGDRGNGMGVMQIDRRYHPEFAASVQPSDHSKVIRKGAQILKEELNRFNGDTYAALAAYNTGPRDVEIALAAGQDPDAYTTGGDYAKDVLQRYEIIKNITGSSFQLGPIASWLGGTSSKLAPGKNLASMQTIAGLLLVSAAAGTAYLMVKNSRES